MTKADEKVHGPTGLWVLDDVPSARFPVYTRGNTGEVCPNVLTPLGGSIVEEPIAAGQAQVFAEMGAIIGPELDEPGCAVLTGCFGGYLYGNLSVGRLFGARAPGMKPEDADTLIFGTSDAPPYRRQPGDRNLWATARMMRFMTHALRGPDFGWLDRERSRVQEWLAAQPEPATATEEQLLSTVDGGASLLTALMRSLLLASTYGGVAAGVVDRLGSRADPDALARIAGGLGNVESAGPAATLWELARMAAANPAVSACFDGDCGDRGDHGDHGSEHHRTEQAGGGTWARLAEAGSEAAAFRDGMQAFLARFGARGPDEWELASHTWGTDPDIALAAVDRLRHAAGPDPATVAARLAAERAEAVAQVERHVPRPVRGMFRRAVDTGARGSMGRELAKGTIVLALYGMRLALFELVRRAQDGGAPAERLDCWLVTREELPTLLHRPGELAGTIAARRERRDLLQSRVPPFVFEGRIPDPHTWPLRQQATSGSLAAGACLTGLPVSAGVARGPVRVVRDPARPDALQPGDVLVAPITDPAWTPLFLVASAVVCDVGARLSHAAIVARELGIPAVVSVEGATGRLADGALVEVDGTRGTVTVL